MSRVPLMLLVCVGFLVLVTGCQVAPRVNEPMRAIWVTRYDYKTPADVEAIVENCADAGFSAILFQVRGNGTAFYKSEIEPWAEQFDFEDPGFDPLTLACEQARARDVELHAWVNVMPAWRGTEPPPEDVGQLYTTHPEWFWYDQNGDRQALSSFYVSLNPCLPEVRDYIVDVFQEIVTNYDIDGLHMDYIRFPNEPPATPRGSGLDYPRDAQTLALYKEATGLTPDEDKQAWNDWRTECVTELVRDIHDMMRAKAPGQALTASVGASYDRSLAHFRDDRTWAREKLLDAAFLMNYTDEPKVFAERIKGWTDEAPPIPIVPGLWFGRHRDETVEQAIDAVAQQIEIGRAMTGNFCIFAYSSMFDSKDEQLARQNEKQRTLRAKRRMALVPVIQKIDEADTE